MTDYFSSLPAEVVADILGELDLDGLVVAAAISRRFHLIVSDPSLNPWRHPILRNLSAGTYEPALAHLSVRTTVPRRNWIQVMSVANPSFLLYEATWPNLTDTDWQECFTRRFLPGWKKWKRDGIRWRGAFMMCA